MELPLVPLTLKESASSRCNSVDNRTTNSLVSCNPFEARYQQIAHEIQRKLRKFKTANATRHLAEHSKSSSPLTPPVGVRRACARTNSELNLAAWEYQSPPTSAPKHIVPPPRSVRPHIIQHVRKLLSDIGSESLVLGIWRGRRHGQQLPVGEGEHMSQTCGVCPELERGHRDAI